METYCRAFTNLSRRISIEQPRHLSKSDLQELFDTYFSKMSTEDADRIFHVCAVPDPENHTEIRVNFDPIENWVRCAEY